MHTEQNGLSRRVFLGGSAGGFALATLGLADDAQAVPSSGKRRKLSAPAPMIPPVPAILLSVKGPLGSPDEISVVWTFVVNGDPAQIGISVDQTHVALKGIETHREFVLNVPVAGIVEPFDHRDMKTHIVADKYKLSGLTRGRAVAVDAPTVEECPIHVECRVLKSMDVPPTRRLIVASVVATTVVGDACDESGRLNVSKTPFFGMTAGSGEFYTMGTLDTTRRTCSIT